MISNSNLRQSGFTLIELVVTIAIFAILAAIAIPSFRNIIQNNRQISHANEFVASMHLARSEAVKRGRQVFVTATSPSAGDEWSQGWSVWVDLNSNGTFDAGEEVRNAVAFTDSVTMDSTGVTLFRYDPDGSLGVGAPVGAPNTLDVCDSSRSGEIRRRLSIASNGRVSLDTTGICP